MDESEAAAATRSASDDAQRLRSLLDIAKVVGAIRSSDDMIELTAEEARRALDAASLTISRWDRESGLLRSLVNVGLLGPGEVRFPRDEVYAIQQWPGTFRVVEGRQSFVSTTDQDDPEGRLLAELGKDSAIAVPIVVEARVWGELWATRTNTQRRFTDADLDFGVAVATQVAAGVVQADHFARIERLAFEDPLTGLANRRAVDELLEKSMAAFSEVGMSVALVLADINRLKQVNDSFGHDAGDRTIVAVGDAVSRASGLVPDSLAARIGGDEFCIVMTGVSGEQALRVAQELCSIVDRQPMSTGVSCGVASTDTMPGGLDSPVRLFRLADAAQYRAKRSGCRAPVVAGRTAPDPDDDDAPVDRRARRGRLAVDNQAVLDSGLELLDRLSGRGPRQRVEAIADLALSVLDASAWWVSHQPTGCRDLVTVSSSVQRTGEPRDEVSRAQAEIGAVFSLDEYPATDAALRDAGTFLVELGAPGNDPAEEACLVAAGYTGVMGTGAIGADGGWLIEVYADSISLPLAGPESVLRALMVVAVTGASVTSA